MIPVLRVPEPSGFAEVRKRGNEWLANNPDLKKRPPSYWREFNEDLGKGSNYLCGYMAQWDLNGTIDHFVSVDENRSKAYEWDNYRYVTGWVNSSKQNVLSTEILDPHEVEDGWFEIRLPSLELVLTSKVPPEKRARAERTIQRLPIGRDGRAIKRRGVYYDIYIKRGIKALEMIREQAPLLAAAIEKELSARSGGPAGP